MEEIVISTYEGRFNLPNKILLWLLRREIYYLFNNCKYENSHFAPSVIRECIENEEKDFAGKYDEKWGYWNNFVVDHQDEKIYEIKSSVKVGKNRTDEKLVEAINFFNPEDFDIVSIPEDLNYKIEKDAFGERIVQKTGIEDHQELDWSDYSKKRK